MYPRSRLDQCTVTRVLILLVDSGLVFVPAQYTLLVEFEVKILLVGARDRDPALVHGVKFTKAYYFRGARRCGEWRVYLCFTDYITADPFTTEMDMSVQVESEDQDIVTNTPLKRRTRAMRIIDYDEESAVEEEEEEADEEEEDAEGVRLPSLTSRLLSNYFHLDSQKRMSWSPTRNRKFQPLLPRG